VSERLVDWPLAERLATSIGGDGPAWDGDADELQAESARAAHLVRRYTGLRPRSAIPDAELIDRRDWARVNLDSFRDMSGEVERALAERMEESGGGAGLGRKLASAATGAQVGLTVGYLSQKVVGQYDVALIGPTREPRLLFVGPNLSSARDRLGVDRELFLSWIALHETTHAVQFSAVPWLRPYLGGIASELFGSAAVEVRPGDLLSKLTSMNPKELLRSVTSGELATLLLTDSQRAQVDRLMAAMTVVEGYAEHVMDAVGDQLDSGYAELRRRLDSDREHRGPLDAIVGKLLGLDMKMAQYKRGKVFCDAVAERADIRALNVVWRDSASLPTSEELDDPEAWLARTGAASRTRRILARLA
jgi:coenzyme F420 biosynthesis associated uncharacterized protein